MTAPDGPLGRPRFSRTSSRVMSPRALGLLHPHPLTLLHFLHGLIDYETGALREGLTYRHQDGAKALGIPVRTARDFFDRLEQADLLRRTRTFRGLRFRLLGLPPGKWHQAATYEPEGGTERQHAATNEEIVAGSCTPSGSTLPLVKESEDSERGSGETPTVDQAAALTPPDEKLLGAHRAAVVEAQRTLRRKLPVETLTAIASAIRQLHDLSQGEQDQAVVDAARHIVAHAAWNPEVPQLWADQVAKAAGARRLTRPRRAADPVPEARFTAPDPEQSAAEREEARTRLPEWLRRKSALRAREEAHPAQGAAPNA